MQRRYPQVETDVEPAVIAALLSRRQQTYVAVSWLKVMAMKFKHPAFHHEQEWRILVRDPPATLMEFRAGHADVKPYIKLTPDRDMKLPLNRVLFGPTLRKDAVMIDTIGLMLEKYGHQPVPVQPCQIPYRL